MLTPEQEAELRRRLWESISYCLRDDVWYLVDHPHKKRRLEDTKWGRELERPIVERMVEGAIYDVKKALEVQ